MKHLTRAGSLPETDITDIKKTECLQSICILYIPACYNLQNDSRVTKLSKDEILSIVVLKVCTSLFLLHLLLTYTQAWHQDWDRTHPFWRAVSLVSFNFRRSWIDIDLLPSHDILTNGKQPGANSSSVGGSFWSLTIFAQQSCKAQKPYCSECVCCLQTPTDTEMMKSFKHNLVSSAFILSYYNHIDSDAGFVEEKKKRKKSPPSCIQCQNLKDDSSMLGSQWSHKNCLGQSLHSTLHLK